MNTQLRTLVDLRDRTIQKSRIAFSNRMAAIENGVDTADEESQEIVSRWMGHFDILEKELDKDISRMGRREPIIKEMCRIKGVGPMLAAKAVSMIDIERAETVSSLWRYAGYGVIDGERERPKKGEQLHYNIRLKTTMYLIASSFLKSNSPYRDIYDTAKVYYTENRPDWTKGHCHQAAMRKMTKLFLCHLWEKWREMRGLAIRAPYVQEKLGHTHILPRQQFGWE